MFQVLMELRHVVVNPARLVKNLSEKSGERQVYISHEDFQKNSGIPAYMVSTYRTDRFLRE
jgi:hypothetical protein